MSPTATRINWPLSVREYVQRSFAAENSSYTISRAEIENMLKKIITEAAEQELINIIDWTALPPPQIFIQRQIQYKRRPLAIDRIGYNDDRLERTEAGIFNLYLYRKPNSDGCKIYNSTNDKMFLSWLNTRSDNRPSLTGSSIASFGGQGGQDYNIRKTTSNELVLDSNTKSEGKSNFGTSEKLEKNYYRLTSAPLPETVRPLHVLQEALELLKRRWRADNNYSYMCDQLKSIRQDLTVQHIESEFTVSVYEIHARIALENGDLGEYNQCQTVLRRLHKQNPCGHPAEFIAYRILYFVYTRNRTQMNHILTELTSSEKAEFAINHALLVRSALALGNIHKFFRLYLSAPNMGAYLMDIFIERERVLASKVIYKA